MSVPFEGGRVTHTPERRQYPRIRVPIDQVVSIRLDEELRTPREFGVLENLSRGGMCVRLSRFGVRRHTTLPLQFANLQQPGPIRVTGKICWINGHAGIAFRFVPDESLLAICNWIADHDARNAPPDSSQPASEPVDATPVTLSQPACVLGAAETQSGDPELTQLAETGCRLVAGSGIAIAVRRGDTFESRASVGHAPSVGARTSTEGGLSGECIRSGEIVMCQDARHDLRIRIAEPESLGFESACLVPFVEGDTVVGLIIAFRDHPSVFDHHDVDVLRMVASAASILARRSEKESAQQLG